MRLLALFFVLGLLTACGKESSSGSSSYCSGGLCEGIRQEHDMDRPSELLEAKVDTSVKLTNDEIVFLQDANNSQQALNTTCGLDVKAGDRYRFSRQGDVLEVYKPNGQKYSMKRMSYSDDSLAGSWAWRGYEGDIYKVYQYTFVGTGRIIMRLHCEN